MSLENLASIRQLQPHVASPAQVQRLLAAAARNLSDSANAEVSDESRFDMAYKAVMQCAMVALLARGFRPSTTLPGHHQTLIQTLELTLGVDKPVWVVLDALRRKRNLSDYQGDPVEPAAVQACRSQAQALFSLTQAWLSQHRPELLAP